jgi:uncharacterized protein YjeT (DUF2065 family)
MMLCPTLWGTTVQTLYQTADNALWRTAGPTLYQTAERTAEQTLW